ncbi:phage terminase large subunit [Nioella aestuarii]|uniref:phage terminase large subunit n=1 Tax=Nioella aestuarii TaxID=1662864 RepID=UPI003D7F4EC4
MTDPSAAIVVRSLYRQLLFPFVQRAFLELRPGTPFHEGPHVRAICHALERVERGDVRRLLILMPPRHLKSFCASVVFPAWALGRNPARRIICMSYGLDLAEGFSRDSRRLIDSTPYRGAFPGLQLDPKRSSVEELRTLRNGFRMATSSGGALTGKGGDILILDDPSKAADVASETQRDKVHQWFTDTVMTRLDNPKSGAVIVVAQRLHHDDLPGRLIATGGWEVLELPAIAPCDCDVPMTDNVDWNREKGTALLPEHMDIPQFEEKRREVGARAFEAQYQQAPQPAGGSIIKPEWFGEIPPHLRRGDYEAIIQSWDTAAVPGETNDYSVCTTWGLLGNHVDLLDAYRGQQLQPDLLRIATKLRERWKPNLIMVESVGVGTGFAQQLERQDRKGVRWYTPKGSKVDRMVIQSPKLEGGQVRLPRAAPWKERFLAEAAAFPNGKYDDQVDSMSQALFALDCNLFEIRHCSRFKGPGYPRARVLYPRDQRGHG